MRVQCNRLVHVKMINTIITRDLLGMLLHLSYTYNFSFDEHYSGKRTPFNMVIDPAWAANSELNAGTLEFLQYVRASYGVCIFCWMSCSV